MPLALILSSHVAASRVGGFPQALALAQWGIDPVLIPTVLFGRRPGRGAPPGGGAVDPALFRGMLDGAEAHGAFGWADVAITGYFASADQVRAAAGAIDRIRAADRTGAFRSAPTVVVDPIMGDAPDGLYVQVEVAEAIAAELLPRADLLTPNLWELRRLTGAPAETPADVAEAARTLGRPVLVTSVPAGPGRTGAVYADRSQALHLVHAEVPGTPHGTGDVVAAILAAAVVNGQGPAEAAEAAIRGVAECVLAAAQWRAPELPIVALGPRLRTPTASVSVQRLAERERGNSPAVRSPAERGSGLGAKRPD